MTVGTESAGGSTTPTESATAATDLVAPCKPLVVKPVRHGPWWVLCHCAEFAVCDRWPDALAWAHDHLTTPADTEGGSQP